MVRRRLIEIIVLTSFGALASCTTDATDNADDEPDACECPASPPEGACGCEGTSCDYGCLDADCSNGRWNVYNDWTCEIDAGPVRGCPEQPPHSGQACSPHAARACYYPLTEPTISAECYVSSDYTEWQVTDFACPPDLTSAWNNECSYDGPPCVLGSCEDQTRTILECSQGSWAMTKHSCCPPELQTGDACPLEGETCLFERCASSAPSAECSEGHWIVHSPCSLACADGGTRCEEPDAGP